jgi:hypothetical protein
MYGSFFLRGFFFYLLEEEEEVRRDYHVLLDEDRVFDTQPVLVPEHVGEHELEVKKKGGNKKKISAHKEEHTRTYRYLVVV